MRTLRFIVEGNTIKRDPACDFTHIKPGSAIEIQAEFIFSDEWNGFIKAVDFYNRERDAIWGVALDEFNRCYIPSECLEDYVFYLRVVGRKHDTWHHTELLGIGLDGR